MGDFQTIADQFVEYYYKAFDSDRNSLSALYRPQSMMTWEKEPFMGEKIIEKLVGLPFQKIQHRVDTKDAQPSNDSGGIMVMVTGALMFDDQPQPMNYVQVFNLMSEGGNYFVQNDVFRLVYPS